MLFLIAFLIFISCVKSAVDPPLVAYYVFTKESPNIKEPVTYLSSIDKDKPVFIVIHGFIGTGLCDHCLRIKEQFLKKFDCVVILYDWSQTYTDYRSGVFATKIAGRILAEQLLYLYEEYQSVHLIAMGLGSHVAGQTGKRLNEYVSDETKKLARISAIDPAGPLFNASNHETSLWKSDAQQVIAYHCDGGKYGLLEPVGGIDYYVNGGEGSQPGCQITNMNGSFLDYLTGDINQLACSHRICRVFFIDAINSNGTLATECENYENFKEGRCAGNREVVFGDNVGANVTGRFYVAVTCGQDYRLGPSLN